MAQEFSSIDGYIRSFPGEVQAVLEEIRARGHKTVPEAGERISYQIPTLTLNGRNLVHFAGWKHHVSLYPIPDGDEAYRSAIAPYQAGKGTLKFLLRDPVPYELVERTVQLLYQEHIGRN